MPKFSYKLGGQKQIKPNFTLSHTFRSRFLSFKKSRSVLSLAALTLLFVVSANAAFSSDGRSFFGIFDYSGSKTTTTNSGGNFVPDISKPYDFLNLLNLKPNRAAATFVPAFAIGTNLDQLQNGNSSKSAEWANGNINSNNSCYAEGDVVPYRYFVTGLGPVAEHHFTIRFEFTRAGIKAFDYLTKFDLSEAGVLAGLTAGACSNTATPAPSNCSMPSPVATFQNPTTYFPSGPGGYGGDALLGPQQLYAYNVSSATAGTPTLVGSAAGNSDVEIVITFTPAGPGDVGFFWGGHLAMGTPGTWGIGKGSGAVSGAPFHMRGVQFDDSGGANQDRSIQNGSVCLPPQAAITTDAETYCPGSENHTATAPAGAASYTWTIAGGTITSGQGTGSITFKVDPFLPASGQTGCMGKVVLGLSACTSTGACPGDSCCNKATKEITVVDNTAPVISGVGAEQTVECSGTPVFSSPTATDSCDPSVSLTFTDSNTPGSCPGNYSVTRTWTATDKCGNSSTASQKVNVKDTIAPVIAALPGPSTIQCPATPSFAQATATDACDPSVTLTFVDATTPGSCPGNSSMTRTWTATDDCGNSSTATQTINIADTTAPVIAALPAPSTIQCPATPSFAQATATDTCDPTVTLTFVDATTGTCPQVATRTWTATDDCGNSSTATQTINIADTTAPVIAALPAPSTIQCPATPSFAQAIATDTCDPTVTLTFVDATTGTCPQVATRTWTATDDCGNSSTATQTINIADTTAPVIAALPGPTTIECTGTPSFAQATATDACDPTVTLTFVDATTPGSCAGNYSVTRTWTATDDCNNTSTATQTINVADTTAPLISGVGGSATIECPLTPVFSSPTASDACGAATLSFADVVTPGSCPQQYSVTRTWTATDACGLKSTASQTINVVDTTGPTIGDFSPASVEVCFGSPVTVPTLTATDACSGAATVMYTRSDGKPLGDPYPVGTTTVTAKAVDACGNSSVTRTFTVVVKDCAQVFCSLTQGGWGNSNGKFNGEVRIDTIKRLITAGSPLIIGSNGRTISFTDGFEQCLIDKMPAGGPAAVLPVGVVDGCNVPAAMLKNGKLNSVIWGQTIALSMNVRLDPNLGGKALCKTMITAKALPGPDGKVGTSDDILEAPGADLNLDGVPDNYLKVTIPNSVIQGISTLGLGAPTVNNILALANRALGGQSTGGASLGDINAALDAINQGFDECRFLMSCTN